MEIEISSDLQEHEFERLFKWREQVFPIEGKGYIWAKPKRHIIARKNGQAVGHIGFGIFSLCGSENRNIVGVGGVVVRPEFQGQRIPEKMFDILGKTSELKADTMQKALFCPHRLVSYYNKHKFEIYRNSVQFLQNEVYVETDKFVFMVQGPLSDLGKIKIPSCPW